MEGRWKVGGGEGGGGEEIEKVGDSTYPNWMHSQSRCVVAELAVRSEPEQSRCPVGEGR